MVCHKTSKYICENKNKKACPHIIIKFFECHKFQSTLTFSLYRNSLVTMLELIKAFHHICQVLKKYAIKIFGHIYFMTRIVKKGQITKMESHIVLLTKNHCVEKCKIQKLVKKFFQLMQNVFGSLSRLHQPLQKLVSFPFSATKIYCWLSFLTIFHPELQPKKKQCNQ